MAEIEEDVSFVRDDVELLLDEQVIQDQRIFNLEEETHQLEDNVEGSCPFFSSKFLTIDVF